MREVDNTWTSDATTNANPRFSSVLTTLSDTGQQSRVDFISYDANGCLTDQKEYDFGLTLKREITRTYLSTYSSNHILDRPTQEIVKDANGNNVSRTDYAYDGITPSPTITGAANHNDSFSGPRANLTSITRYTDPVGGTGAIARSFSYDSLGNLVTAQLDCCNQKQWNFSNTPQYAYPDSVVSGPPRTQLTTSATYNLDTGTVATSTDENLKVTQYVYDSMNRIFTVTQPDSVVITYADDDAGVSPSISVSNSANSAVRKTVFDGLGRTTMTQFLSGTTVVTSQATQYDDIHLQVKKSNPYAPNESQVWTTSQFHALGRASQTTPPSGGNIQYQYSGNAVTVTDPSGKQRRSLTDAQGLLVEVDEPGETFSGVASGGSFGVNGSLQSTVVGAHGTNPATATLAISGEGQCTPTLSSCDGGTVTITVGSDIETLSYGGLTTAQTIAQNMASQFNKDSTQVTAAASQISDSLHWQIVFTAKASGSSGNGIAFSTSQMSFLPGQFPAAYTFNPGSGSTSGGQDASSGTTVYDAGTVTITVSTTNGPFTASASYGQCGNSSASLVASALTSTGSTGLNRSESPVNAHLMGTTVVLSYSTPGVVGNVAVNCSSSTSQSAYFSSPSFGCSPSNFSLSNGEDPYSSGLAHPYVTTYTYDPLGNLTLVSQAAGNVAGQPAAGQPRSYTYDGLPRLTKSVLPESGTTSFTYTDFGAVNTRTDNRGVVTTYGYDGLNRLSSITYNVGSTDVPATPTVTFTYGNSAVNNNNGRLLQMTDGVGSETYTYNSTMGRITQISKVINGTTYNIYYGYNSAGELNSLTYPSGRAVNPGYDAVGRMTQIVDGGGASYLSGMTFNSAQLPAGFTYGNGVQASFGYNDHQQLVTLGYTSGSNTLLSLTYDYADTNGNNNGQIQGITDSRSAAFSTTYGYDTLARLSQAQTSDLNSANTWRLAWGYDRFGNRLSQTLTGGTLSVGQPQLSVDANTNHITSAGFLYDANGNLVHDPNGTYTFDATNRMTQSIVGATTTSYTYDGNNLRVLKGVNTVYIYSGDKVIADYVNGSLNEEYIYAESKLIATVTPTTVTYHHADHFSGSARELVETGILGCFPESHEFSPGHRHALGLEQQVMQIFVAAPAP